METAKELKFGVQDAQGLHRNAGGDRVGRNGNPPGRSTRLLFNPISGFQMQEGQKNEIFAPHELG